MKNVFKKLLSLAVCLVMAVSVPGAVMPAQAKTYLPPFDMPAEAVYMVNMDTGLEMVSVNADKRIAPASLTKIMTAILTIENVADLENETVRLKMYLNDMIYNKGASTGGYWPNDVSSVKDALGAMLVQSAGECALMLADYVGDGSVNHFIDMMNERAAELGCTDTHFTNPHGLYDEDQYTTARDMYKIAKHAMTLPVFRDIVKTDIYEVQLTNRNATLREFTTNKLITKSSSYYHPAVEGIKTGSLPEVGKCLVTQATQGGYTYMLVLLGVPTPDEEPNQIFGLAKNLFNWAFDNFSVRTAIEMGEELVEIPVRYGVDRSYTRLATGEQFTALLNNQIDLKSIRFKEVIPDFIAAPVEEGEVIGKLELYFAEEKLGDVDLIATESIKRSGFWYALGWFGNELHTFHAKAIVVAVLILIAIGIALLVEKSLTKRRKGRYTKNKYYM